MSDVSLFDYAGISADAVTEVRAAAERIRVRMKRTAEDIIAIGLDLITVKERLPHGAFLPWIEAEFGMGERAARNFMRVADRYGSKSAIIADLPPTVLYELAAPSTPETIRQLVEDRAAVGEGVSVEEVKRLKRELSNAKESAGKAEAERDRYRKQAETALDSQRDLVAKAAADARASIERELEIARQEAAENRAALERETARLNGLVEQAGRAAEEKAAAKAAALAEAELNRRQRALDEAESELEKVRADIRRRSEIKDRLAKEVEQHEQYLRSMRNSDQEARQLASEMDELQRVLALTLLTVSDLSHEHSEEVLRKVATTSEMCRKTHEALEALCRPRLVYDAREMERA